MKDDDLVPSEPTSRHLRPADPFWQRFEEIAATEVIDRDNFVEVCLECAGWQCEGPRLTKAATVLRRALEECGEELRPALLSLLAEDLGKMVAAAMKEARYGKAANRQRA